MVTQMYRCIAFKSSHLCITKVEVMTVVIKYCYLLGMLKYKQQTLNVTNIVCKGFV